MVWELTFNQFVVGSILTGFTKFYILYWVKAKERKTLAIEGDHRQPTMTPIIWGDTAQQLKV